MKVLFMSLSDYDTINDHGIYTDLLREFVKHGHEVFLISPIERRSKKKETIIYEQNVTILKPRIWNMQKTNIVEKGISMMTIDKLIIRGIKKHFSKIKFDLILYPTPPITLLRAVEYVKKRDNAKTYLLLKDIFPQNALDLGLLNNKGIKGIIYKRFREQEKKLYEISDMIGCMSKANVEYVLSHNPNVCPDKIEVCPNSIEVIERCYDEKTKEKIKIKYGIPLKKTILVYGGNLGKPQDIPFIIKCLEASRNNENVHFLIVGSGTEYKYLLDSINKEKLNNVTLISRLPKNDYETLICSCDIGLIFLDHRFTIPNYPSRLLSYMQAKLPVLACTDLNSDIGKTIIDGQFGWWCESNNTDMFCKYISNIDSYDLVKYGNNAFSYLCNNYSSNVSYSIIAKNFVK